MDAFLNSLMFHIQYTFTWKKKFYGNILCWIIMKHWNIDMLYNRDSVYDFRYFSLHHMIWKYNFELFEISLLNCKYSTTMNDQTRHGCNMNLLNGDLCTSFTLLLLTKKVLWATIYRWLFCAQITSYYLTS